MTGKQESHGAELAQEAAKWIQEAAKHDIELSPGNFEIIDGDLYIDGMDPGEWIDAMTMD